MAKLSRWYRAFAIIFLNTLLLFVVVNGGLSVAAYVKNYLLRPYARQGTAGTALEQYGMQKTLQAHPGWTEDDVIEFFQADTRMRSEYEAFTQFRPKGMESKFINISPNGYRLVKNQGPWPLDSNAFNVFVFGGSTAFGSRVADQETIASWVQEYLAKNDCGKQVCVYNFGRPSYFSTQERILFEELILSENIPSLAVFIDGINDIGYWDGVPSFTYSLQMMVEEANRGWSVMDRFADFLESLPVTRAAKRLRELVYSENIKKTPEVNKEIAAARAINQWLTNKKMVETIADASGVHTLFVWQPVPTYKYDLKCHLFWNGGRSSSPDLFATGYTFLEQSGMRKDLERSGNLLWLADMQSGRAENLYVDALHYTACFSKEIASQIGAFIEQGEFGLCSPVP